MGYSPWGHKKLEMTEQLNTGKNTSCFLENSEMLRCLVQYKFTSQSCWRPIQVFLCLPYSGSGMQTKGNCIWGNHLALSATHVDRCLKTLGNPMDCSPPGFSVYGILQARVLE